MTLWLTMLAAGAVTFAIRLSFIGAAGSFVIPGWFERMLRFVPVAALSALVWPDLMIAASGIDIAQPRMLAGMLAAAIAWRTRNIALTIGGGMLALWIIQWLANQP